MPKLFLTAEDQQRIKRLSEITGLSIDEIKRRAWEIGFKKISETHTGPPEGARTKPPAA